MLKDSKPLLYVVASDDRVYFDFDCLGPKSEEKEIVLKILDRLYFDKDEPPAVLWAVSWVGKVYFDLKKWPQPTPEIEEIAQQALNGPCSGSGNKQETGAWWARLKLRFGRGTLPLLYITPDDRIFFGLKKWFMDDPKSREMVLKVLGSFFDKNASPALVPDDRGVVYVDLGKWPMTEGTEKLIQERILDKLRLVIGYLHEHVTPGGRVYFDPEEYLGTPKAQRIIATFNEVLKKTS